MLMVIFKSWYFLYSVPKPLINLNLINETLSLRINSPFAIPRNKKCDDVINIIQKSFQSYFELCNHSDYLMPLSHTCLNDSRIGMTKIEALDTLYISNLTDLFNGLREFKLNEFEDSSNINFYDLGTRVLGGLISIYYLTGHSSFLESAQKIADHMTLFLNKGFPPPLLNLKFPISFPNPLYEGTILGESSGFLIEFATLSKLSNNSSYKKFIRHYLECTNKFITDQYLPSFWSSKCQPLNNSSNDFELSSFNAAFIANVIKLHVYDPTELTKNLLDKLIAFLNKQKNNDFFSSEGIFHSSLCLIIPSISLLNSSNKIITSIQNKLISQCEKLSMKGLLRNEMTKKQSFDSHFTFHSSLLENSLILGIPLPEIDNRYFSCGFSQCQLINIDPTLFDNIQPSQVFGSWLKYQLLENCIYPRKDFIFNGAGHLMPLI